MLFYPHMSPVQSKDETTQGTGDRCIQFTRFPILDCGKQVRFKDTTAGMNSIRITNKNFLVLFIIYL